MTLKVLISFLLNWISVNTDYKTEGFGFPVIVISKSELEVKACRGKCPILAFFSSKEGILISKMDFNGLCNQSIILHEIIHALQFTQRKDMENVFKEKEAYEIQNFFLTDMSIEKELIKPLSIRKCRSIQGGLGNKLL